MGMDPKTVVWYGVGGYNLKITDAAGEREEEDWFRTDDQPQLRSVYVMDTRVGFGAELIRHDWNDSPELLDLNALAAKAEVLKAAVDPLLDALQVEGERGVFLASNYS